MQLLKRVGLGVMFWVGGTIGFLIVGIIIGVVHRSAATRSARCDDRRENLGKLGTGNVNFGTCLTKPAVSRKILLVIRSSADTYA